MDNLPDLNNLIKKEASEILEAKGLLEILEQYGIPHISGSYFLNLMTWRDLDIYLEVDAISEMDFFTMGGRIAAALNPVKMSFRNETIARTKGLPDGLYWGIYLGDERAGAWKIDIWAVNSAECARLLDYCTGIREKVTPEKAQHILNIKSQCWTDREYRRSYTSMDIYEAVLEKGMVTIEAFREYLKNDSRKKFNA